MDNSKEWVHSEGVSEIVPVQDWRDAGKTLLQFIWVDTDKSVDPAHKQIRSRLCTREYKTKKQGKVQRANHYVCELVEQRKTTEGETLTSAEHIFKKLHKDSSTSDFQQKIVRNMARTELAD